MSNRKKITAWTLAAVLILSCLWVFPAAGSAVSAGTPINWKAVNPDDNFVLTDVPDGVQVIVPTRYLFAMHKRAEAYNPSSVLISGVLYAPAGTQILRAVVTPVSRQPLVVQGEEIWRCPNQEKPDAVSSLQFKPDEARAGFAFLVDMAAAGLTEDGEIPVNVKLLIDQNIEPELSTVVSLRSDWGVCSTLPRALRGRCIELNDQDNDQVREMQQRLVELRCLDQSAAAAVWDAACMQAANELLSAHGLETDPDFLSPEAVGFLRSGQSAANTGGSGGFFSASLTLFGLELPLWFLSAVALALLAILLLILWVVLGKRKRTRRDVSSVPAVPDKPQPVAKVLTTWDAPAADAGSTGGSGPGLNRVDIATTPASSTSYALQLRLIYGGQYTDQNILLHEGEKVTIGRSSSAGIHTHPADKIASSLHGFFMPAEEMLKYTDSSRNGTRFNGQKLLQSGETVNIPLNAKAQLDIGRHKVLVQLVRK